MDVEFSKASFFKFLDFLSDKDLVKHQTVRGWKSASTKLLVDLSQSEEEDVRRVDIKLASLRLSNREPDALTPKSLHTYEQRVVIAIREFEKRQQNPSGYRPRGLSAQTKKSSNSGDFKKDRSKDMSDKSQLSSENLEIPVAKLLTLTYPVRSDALAQVSVPFDLTTVEAKRIGGFLLTLAVDYEP